MDITLPSKKSINIKNIKFVNAIRKVHNWYYFIIDYKDRESIQLSYYTENAANSDRDYILSKLNPIEKFL